jgi:DDE family transposase
MTDDALAEDWAILAHWLPEDLDADAKAAGFLRRARGLQDAGLWLRLMLMHVAGGLSLKQTSVRARELGLAEVSGVALFKRLRVAERWLRRLTKHLLAEQRQRLRARAWPWKGSLRVIDATEVQEPGSTGSCWRVHYSLRLPEMACDYYELTDAGGGEKLGRFEFRPNELVLVDRGYSHRAGVARVLEAQAHVIMRWNHALFPLQSADGGSFRVLAKLKSLRVGQEAAWRVCFEHEGRRWPLRLCVRRKGRLAAQRALRKSLRKAQKNGTTPDSTSLKLTEYILVLTSVPDATMSTHSVLDCYRCRWQVELAFKRLKTLLGMGHVPKSNDASAMGWMQAKILIALLIERTILEARLFSPWGDGR